MGNESSSKTSITVQRERVSGLCVQQTKLLICTVKNPDSTTAEAAPLVHTLVAATHLAKFTSHAGVKDKMSSE